MGYMRHHAIVVTSAHEDRIQAAHQYATALMDLWHDGLQAVQSPVYVSPISHQAINGYQSFFVGTDGSKLGWDDDIQGDEKRAALVRYLRTQDGWLQWFEAQYGDDNGETKICAASED